MTQMKKYSMTINHFQIQFIQKIYFDECLSF